jgi:hypothetical protein
MLHAAVTLRRLLDYWCGAGGISAETCDTVRAYLDDETSSGV